MRPGKEESALLRILNSSTSLQPVYRFGLVLVC